MSLDPCALAVKISSEIGLPFLCAKIMNQEGGHSFEIWPADHPPSQTFILQIKVGWRRIEIIFQPGKFSAHLMEKMGLADEVGRQSFRSVLRACLAEGADVLFSVNGAVIDPEDDNGWNVTWRRLSLEIRKGMLSINEGDNKADAILIDRWALRATAAICALLPIEEISSEQPESIGLPEGAVMRVEVNRYERDRRNRAAALAIHGYTCQGCQDDMSDRYGSIAAGMIEVHHVTPVSQIGENHIVDPRFDLVPLCPNCHTAIHRRTPPLSLTELRNLLIQRR